MKTRQLNASGFTLIEVLIAMVLIVVGLLAFGVFSGTLVRQNANTTRDTVGTTLAQEKIEDLKNEARNGALTAVTNQADPDNPITAPGGSYTRTWTISADTGTIEVSTISVTVSWPGTPARSVTVATRISGQ